MASLDDDGIPYERPEAMLRSDDSSSEEDMPSSRRGGARLDVNSGKYVVPGQTTLGFGREQKSFLKPAAAKQNVAKTVATSSGSGAVAKASAAKARTDKEFIETPSDITGRLPSIGVAADKLSDLGQKQS